MRWSYRINAQTGPHIILPDKLSDPGYSQTSAADYWTQPSASWWAPTEKPSQQPCWWPWALCSWEAQFHTQTAELGGGAEPGGRDWWESKDEHLTESATWEPSNRRSADQEPFVSVRLGFASSLLVSIIFIHTFLVSFIRRSSSIDKYPLSSGAPTLLSLKRDMVRSESLRVDSGDRTHRIFRPSDLIHGEVLGKGFFGQAVKVLQFLHIHLWSLHSFCLTFFSLHLF